MTSLVDVRKLENREEAGMVRLSHHPPLLREDSV
jgi:hypothetical protein